MQIDLNWILIEIKYPNKCIVCQEKIIVGSKELWKKGEGVKHQKYLQEQLNSAKG